ncbi:hypothetical protein ABPG74_003894 [Tetrahymena malaccensis]
MDQENTDLNKYPQLQNQINDYPIQHVPIQTYFVGQLVKNQEQVCPYEQENQQAKTNDQEKQNQTIIIKSNPDQINIQYSSPEIIYCTASMRSGKVLCNVGVGVNGITNALQQIYQELNLQLPIFSLIGSLNLLSSNQMNHKVIKPIIDNNQNINSEIIKNGKIAYCCKALQMIITKQFYYLITILSVCLLMLIIGYAVYINNSVSGNQLAAPFIIHIILTIIQMILLTFSLLFCLPKLIQFNIFLAALNNLYTVIIFMISFFIENGNKSYDFLGDRLVIQIPCFLMFVASVFFFCVIKSATQRLLILVKQAGQLEFIDGCCI